MKGWIRGNTKIGPALEVAVGHHQGRYGTENTIESLFGDESCSWIMIVNGINKYVTEMTEDTQEDHIDYIGDCTGKLVAEARPKQTSIISVEEKKDVKEVVAEVVEWILSATAANDSPLSEMRRDGNAQAEELVPGQGIIGRRNCQMQLKSRVMAPAAWEFLNKLRTEYGRNAGC